MRDYTSRKDAAAVKISGATVAPIHLPAPEAPRQSLLPAALRTDGTGSPSPWTAAAAAGRPAAAVTVRVIGRALLRAAVESLLAARPATTSSPRLRVLGASEAGVADVILLLGGDGIDALRAEGSLTGSPRVILMTGARNTPAQVEEEFRAARRFNTSVFVSDEDSVEVLVQAVEKAGQGEWFCSQVLFPQIMRCLCEARPAAAAPHPAPVPTDTVPAATAPKKVAPGRSAVATSAAPQFGTAAAVTAPEVVLSGREEEIAFQAARGHSNVEIAAALQLSVATVKFHLFNIYRKLGIVRRGQLGLVLQEQYGVSSFAAYAQGLPRTAAVRSRRVAAVAA